MVKIHIDYEGNLRCRLTHAPSGNQITTDAPVDNMGKGEAFSPTDLAAAALGSCMLTVMGIAARKISVELSGATADIEKEMIPAPIRRIGKISVIITMPQGIPISHRKTLEEAGRNCPVRKSLGPDVETPVRFIYPD